MLSDEALHSSQVADVSQLLNQNNLNDLVRHMVFTQEKSEHLSSRLKHWNILQKGVNRTYFRSRHANFQDFFLHRIMCVIAATLTAFLKNWNLSIIPITGGCLLIQVKQA